MWYEFSKLIPKLLAKLALRTESEYAFSRLISISNEEMGNGNIKSVHSDLFREACLEYSIKTNESINIKSFEVFKDIQSNKFTDSYILGLHLGLEIIANENVEQLIKTLGQSNNNKIALTKFFTIHLVNEDEHIEKCVHNYKRCKTLDQKSEFMEGFNLSISFWIKYWNEAARNDK
jgi:hypothetical protein